MEKKLLKQYSIFRIYLLIIGIFYGSVAVKVISKMFEVGAERVIIVGSLLECLCLFLLVLLGTFLNIRKQWFRMFTIAVCIVSGAWTAWRLSISFSNQMVVTYLGIQILLVNILPVIYLTRPKVKEQFK